RLWSGEARILLPIERLALPPKPIGRGAARGGDDRATLHVPASSPVSHLPLFLRRPVFAALRCAGFRFPRAARARSSAPFRRRTPPRNALALSPSRAPVGSVPRSLALPPPRTT